MDSKNSGKNGPQLFNIQKWGLPEPYLHAHMCLNKVKIMLQPMVSQPLCLSAKHPTGAQDQLLLSDSCGFVDMDAPSDKRPCLSFTIAAGPRQRSHIYHLLTFVAILLHEF
jgi:hypothetical protein